ARCMTSPSCTASGRPDVRLRAMTARNLIAISSPVLRLLAGPVPVDERRPEIFARCLPRHPAHQPVADLVAVEQLGDASQKRVAILWMQSLGKRGDHEQLIVAQAEHVISPCPAGDAGVAS